MGWNGGLTIARRLFPNSFTTRGVQADHFPTVARVRQCFIPDTRRRKLRVGFRLVVGFGRGYKDSLTPDNWLRPTVARQADFPQHVVIWSPRFGKLPFANNSVRIGAAELAPILWSRKRRDIVHS